MYSYKTRVRYSELDEAGKLSILGLFNYLQDTAIFHCEEVGRSVSALAHDGRAWYVLGWEIDIYQLPCLGDEIVLETWVPNIKGRVSQRRLRLSDRHGKTLVDVNSSWVLFDVASGKAIRIPEEEIDYYRAELTNDATKAQRISRIGFTTPYKATPITISEHYLDTNHHVNNARYIELALAATEEIAAQTDSEASTNAAELTELTHSLEGARLLVEYRKMALLGDIIYPEVHPYQGSACIRLNDENGDAYAIVQLLTQDSES